MTIAELTTTHKKEAEKKSTCYSNMSIKNVNLLSEINISHVLKITNCQHMLLLRDYCEYNHFNWTPSYLQFMWHEHLNKDVNLLILLSLYWIIIASLLTWCCICLATEKKIIKSWEKKMTLSILLTSCFTNNIHSFPFCVCLYNDSYRPS